MHASPRAGLAGWLQAVLNDNAQVDKGDNARLSSFVGAIAIADLVKTTLGPKGQLAHQYFDAEDALPFSLVLVRKRDHNVRTHVPSSTTHS